MTRNGTPLIAGAACGRVFRLAAPISFWGGVDPKTARIIQPDHPDFGADISGTILAVAETIGSSSSSAVMLEFLRLGKAPAALILSKVDAILALGVIVGREMGYPTIPVLRLDPLDLRTGDQVTIEMAGAITSFG